MAKRFTAIGIKAKSHSKKTKKRLEIKKVMLATKKLKKKGKK